MFAIKVEDPLAMDDYAEVYTTVPFCRGYPASVEFHRNFRASTKNGKMHIISTHHAYPPLPLELGYNSDHKWELLYVDRVLSAQYRLFESDGNETRIVNAELHDREASHIDFEEAWNWLNYYRVHCGLYAYTMV